MCKLSFITRGGSVTVSAVLKYEWFNGKICGFCVSADNGLDDNNDGCGEAGISDDCDINAIMDATCSVAGAGVTGLCDVKDSGGEGFGDEEGNVNCNDRVDKDEGADVDESVDDDDSTCEDDVCDEGGNEDDICNVGEECKDCRLLCMFTALLAVCSISSIFDDAGDSGILMVDASVVLSRTWVDIQVTFFVTCAWIPVALSPSSCEVFRTGPTGEKMDWLAKLETVPELPIIPGRIIPHDIDEFEEGPSVGAGGEGTGFFFDASSSPFRTF
jgi:hypothetical protein